MNNYGRFSARNSARSCKKSCKILQEILQDLARNRARSCKKSCKILQDVLQDLARHPARSCTTILLLPMQESCKILARPNNLARLLVENLARLARKWPNYVQDCKILARWCARFSIILLQDLCKILQDFSTWAASPLLPPFTSFNSRTKLSSIAFQRAAHSELDTPSPTYVFIMIIHFEQVQNTTSGICTDKFCH